MEHFYRTMRPRGYIQSKVTFLRDELGNGDHKTLFLTLRDFVRACSRLSSAASPSVRPSPPPPPRQAHMSLVSMLSTQMTFAESSLQKKNSFKSVHC